MDSIVVDLCDTTCFIDMKQQTLGQGVQANNLRTLITITSVGWCKGFNKAFNTCQALCKAKKGVVKHYEFVFDTKRVLVSGIVTKTMFVANEMRVSVEVQEMQLLLGLATLRNSKIDNVLA